MSSVAGTEVFSIRMPIQFAMQHSEEHRRPGSVGFDVHQVGWYGEPHAIQVVGLAVSMTEVGAFRTLMLSTVLNEITIVDDYGTTWTRLYVKSARRVNLRGPAANATNAKIYTATWELTIIPRATYY